MKRRPLLLLLLLGRNLAAPGALVCPDVLAFLPGADAVRMANPAFAQHYCGLVVQTVCRPLTGWLNPAFPVRMGLLPPGQGTFFIPWMNRSAALYATLDGSNATYRRWPLDTNHQDAYVNLTAGSELVDVIGYLSPPSAIGVFYYPPWQLVLQYPSLTVTGTDGLNCSLYHYSNDTSSLLLLLPVQAFASATTTTTTTPKTTAMIRPNTTTKTAMIIIIPNTTPKPVESSTSNLAAIIAGAIALPSMALFALALASRYYYNVPSTSAYAAVPPA